MIREIKKAFIELFIYLITLTDSNYSIFFFNVIFIFKKNKLSFGFDKKNKLFFLKDSGKKQYFSNKIRGINLYSSGLEFRANQIADSYKLNNLSFKNADKVIDCGANYGDLWLYLKNKIDIKNYFTFEPGVNEFKSLCKNVKNKNNYNLGLDNKESKKDFYVNEQDADSSIIEPINYDRVHKIETTTLNSFFKKFKLNRVKLLKLEAEGYEPEILLGANKVINKIEFVAIDGGYERGKNLEETLSIQLNFLLKNNFEIIEINLKWGRALLKNKIFD